MKKEKLEIAYLATPYSHTNPDIQRYRYAAITWIAYKLIKSGIHVFSPVTHNVLSDDFDIVIDYEPLMDFNFEMLSRCDKLLVVKLPGWEKSKGVAAEIDCAQNLGTPIEMLEAPDQISLLFARIFHVLY